MSQLHAKREGNVCTLYLDPASNSYAPMRAFDDVPIGTFPQTVHLRQVEALAKQMGAVPVFHSPPTKPPNVIPHNPKVEQEMAKIAKEGPKSEQETSLFSEPRTVLKTSGPAGNVEQEFRLLIARYESAGEEIKPRLKIEVEAVAGFLIRLYPDIKQRLLDIKEQEQQINGGFSLE
jgi:hypothetical protein